MWQYNHLQPNELMHYGKKGMKWGKRKGKIKSTAKTLGSRYKKALEKHESTHDVRSAKTDKAIKNVVTATTIAYGAATAVKYLAMYGNIKSQMNAKTASNLIQIGESFVDFVVS